MDKFKVYNEDYLGGDFQTIEAFDPEQAAETFAEESYWSDEPPESGATVEVTVESEDGTKKDFVVEATYDVSFYAREKRAK